MYEELYKQIGQLSCSIIVFLDEEKISEGSGFAISEDGAVFTAAHVVTGRMRIQERDYRDPNVKIFVKFLGIIAIEYCVAVCGIHISVAAFTENVQIDQALLVPKIPFRFPIAPFTIGSPPRLGEEIFSPGTPTSCSCPFGLIDLYGLTRQI